MGNNRGFNVQEREREKIDEAIELLVRGCLSRVCIVLYCIVCGGRVAQLCRLDDIDRPPRAFSQHDVKITHTQPTINHKNQQEAENPNSRPTEGFEARNSPLTGDWRLIYTNAIDVLLLGLLPTGAWVG